MSRRNENIFEAPLSLFLRFVYNPLVKGFLPHPPEFSQSDLAVSLLAAFSGRTHVDREPSL